eukprot:583791-Rhodomonas_salina.1
MTHKTERQRCQRPPRSTQTIIPPAPAASAWPPNQAHGREAAVPVAMKKRGNKSAIAACSSRLRKH